MSTTTINAPATAIGHVSTASPLGEVAVPKRYTIQLTADCDSCPGELACNIAPDGEVFTWYHRATGRERCDATLTPLTATEEREMTAAPNETDIDRPLWMVQVEEKAEFYAAQWGLRPGQVKVALHDIFSMLSLSDVGPYVESRARAQIDRLAMVLMDEFGGPAMDEGAVDMALRLLRESKAEPPR